jgi:hypothetical protein
VSAQLGSDVVQPDHRCWCTLRGTRTPQRTCRSRHRSFKFTPGRSNTGLGRGQGSDSRYRVRCDAAEISGRFLVAWDPVKQQEQWRVLLGADSPAGGTLATAGGLMFAGNADYNAETGEKGGMQATAG